MKRIATLTLFATLAAGAAALAGRGAIAPKDKPGGDEAGKLRQQIAAKLLFDGLKLSADQRSQLSAKIDEARAFHEKVRAEREPARQAMLKELTAARDEVYRTGTITDATRERLREKREALKPQGDKAAQDRPHIKEDLQKILGPEQLEFLRSFEPMRALGIELPERSHGPGLHRPDAAKKIGERIRSLSDEEYSQKKQAMLDRARKHLEERGAAADEMDRKLDKIASQLDTIRIGTPEQIEALKEDFALPMLLGGAAAEHHGMAQGRAKKLDLLMSPEFQSLLQGKDPLQAR